MDDFLAIVWAVSPTIVLGIFFWFVMRGILRQDRNERQTYEKIRAEEVAKFEAQQRAAAVSEQDASRKRTDA